jgi:hypothetical protein
MTQGEARKAAGRVLPGPPATWQEASAATVEQAVRSLQARWPGWLITAEGGLCFGLAVFCARRPGLEIIRSAAGALESELLRWQRAPGAPDLRAIP